MIGYNHTPISYYVSLISITLVMFVATATFLFPERLSNGWPAVGLLLAFWFVGTFMWMAHLNEYRGLLKGESHK